MMDSNYNDACYVNGHLNRLIGGSQSGPRTWNRDPGTLNLEPGT